MKEKERERERKVQSHLANFVIIAYQINSRIFVNTQTYKCNVFSIT